MRPAQSAPARPLFPFRGPLFFMVLSTLLATCGQRRDSLEEEGSAAPAAPVMGGPELDTATPASAVPEPAFDFRRARLAPADHTGQVRLCDIAYRDRTLPLGPSLRDQRSAYPTGTAFRVDLQCASQDARTWLDLVLSEDAASTDEDLRPGKRVMLRIVSVFGGLLDRTVVVFQAPAGASIAGPAPAPPAADGFDFSRLSGRASEGAGPACSIDFAGQLERVTERQKRRYGYPPGTTLRSSVRCLHRGGDSWLDAVFSPESGSRALLLTRGKRISMQVMHPEGGYGGLPVVVPTSAFLDALRTP